MPELKSEMREKTFITTGHSSFDNLIPQIKTFLEQDSLDVVIDGKPIRGYRSPDAKSLWIRDFSDILRGMKYFEKDLKSMVEHFAETQAANGRIFDYFTTFPDGVLGDEKLKRGAYVNGGILPLVGGELARAAFEHGFEAYGVDILLRYAQMISEYNATYLWYFPDGRPCTAEESTSPEASPTDGWGSSANFIFFCPRN